MRDTAAIFTIRRRITICATLPHLSSAQSLITDQLAQLVAQSAELGTLLLVKFSLMLIERGYIGADTFDVLLGAGDQLGDVH